MKRSKATVEIRQGGSAHSPTVSVIIPAYKVAPFISDTLESVFSQDFTDYEVVVINDGSPDTEQFEQRLTPYLSRIVYLKQQNRGAGAARNAGIQLARGEFVAFLDGDDVWLPNFLSEQIKLIKSGRGYDLVYADAINFGNCPPSSRTNMETNPSSGDVTFEKLLSGECNVITSAVLARRDRILEVDGFDAHFRNSQDFDLWLRLAKDANARITYQKKVLLRRRIYEGSLASDPVRSFQGELAVLRRVQERNDLTPSQQALVLNTINNRLSTVEVIKGKRFLDNGDFAAAEQSFATANQTCSSFKLRLVLLWLRVSPRTLWRAYRFRST